MSVQTVTNRLQRVMNAAAQVVSDTCKYDRRLKKISNDEFHWLNVHKRIEYKLSIMVYRCRYEWTTWYLTDHLIPASDVAPRRLRLRSTNLNRLFLAADLAHTAGGLFCHAGLTAWNSLPDKLRNSSSFDGFEQFLKTNLFSRF